MPAAGAQRRGSLTHCCPCSWARERSPGACVDSSNSAVQHRPAARRSHFCHWPLQSLSLSSSSSPPSHCRGMASANLCLDLSCPQLPSAPRQEDARSGHSSGRPVPAPSLRPPVGGAAEGRDGGREAPARPLPPSMIILPLPYF